MHMAAVTCEPSRVVLKLMHMAAVTCELLNGCIETHANGCCHLWTVHWLYSNSCTWLLSFVNCSMGVLKLIHMAAVTCGLFIGCIVTHARGCCHFWTVHWLHCNSCTWLLLHVDCSLVVLKLMHMAAVTCELFIGCIETHAHGCCHLWTFHWLY